MTFFERQHVARRNSRLIVVLFVLATVCTVLAVDAVVATAWRMVQWSSEIRPRGTPAWLHVLAIGGTTLVILGASAKKILEVHAGGGMAIARMMGARQVVPAQASARERRLLNIVEEMAIASGTRVPVVYVMDAHGGINAFSAGDDRSLTVIVVTRGAIEALNRDELQAVIGHEFSHIVNGDMALNLRMIGVLGGLLFIGAMGEFILRVTWKADEKDARGALIATFVGVALFLIGYIGLFFGRVIKAMVAREREFLADAGSVQFTRNPTGLAGALDQVRRSHSFVLHEHVEDVSHLFFAEAIYLEEERALSTHPPIAERIRRLAPDFEPRTYRDARGDALPQENRFGAQPAVAGARTGDASRSWGLDPVQAAALVGTVKDRDVRAASALLAALPEATHAALREPDSARALVLALALAGDDAVRAGQLAALEGHGLATLGAAANAFVGATQALSPAWHLPVIDLALPELRKLPEASRVELVRALEIVGANDRRMSVLRFALLTFVRAQLEAKPAARKGAGKALGELRDDVALMLSLVAHAGCRNPQSVEADFPKAFAAGRAELQLTIAPLDRDQCSPEAASAALGRLRDLAPLAKARLVKGVFAAITADGTIRVVEAALLRTIGAVLDCPLPPLMDELDPQTLA